MNPTQDEVPSAQNCFLRGQMLYNRNRYADAASWFQRALQADPNHAGSYAMLAACWMTEPDKIDAAVDSAKRAVGLEPEEAHWHSILALAWAAAGRDGRKSLIAQGLEEAKKAVELDPEDAFAHAVQGRMYLLLEKYPEAEASARQALALDTHHAMATQVLSQALLLQHKDEDNSHLIRSQLHKNPEDTRTHTAAGWQALMKGDHRKANEHFLEALRLDPMNESARQGLVNSYRARSVVFRAYLQFCHALARFSPATQRMILIGGFILYRAARAQLQHISPSLAGVLTIAWLTLALWSHLATSVGSFFMLSDRFARQALTVRERWDGGLVGTFIVLALASIVRSFFTSGYWGPDNFDYYAGLAFFIAAVPVAAAFANTHYWGKYLFTIVALVSGGCALYGGLSVATRYHVPHAGDSIVLAIELGAAITWMRLLRIGYHQGA